MLTVYKRRCGEGGISEAKWLFSCRVLPLQVELTMRLLLIVSLVSYAVAFPLDEGLFEGSGAVAIFPDSSRASSHFLEGSERIHEDLEGSGAGDTNLEGSGEIETEIETAEEFALAASEDVLVEAGSNTVSSEARSTTSITEITDQTFENNDGNFSYGFSSSDGTSVETSGEQKRIGDSVGTVMRGSYYYVAPGGEHVKITWVADENGFRAFGDAIPTVPSFGGTLSKRGADIEEDVADGEGSGVVAEDDVGYFDEEVSGSGDIITDDAENVTDNAEETFTSADDAGADSTVKNPLTADDSAPVAAEALFSSEDGATSILEDGVEAAAGLEKFDTVADDGDIAGASPVDELVAVDAESNAAITAAAGEVGEGEEDAAAEGDLSIADNQPSPGEDAAPSAEAALGALGVLARFS